MMPNDMNDIRNLPFSASAAKLAGILCLTTMLAACEESQAQNTDANLTKVVSTFTADVNNDGVADRVDLVFDGVTDVDLNIYLGKKGQEEPDEAPSFVKKAIAFHGNITGQNATLEIGKAGAIQVISMNEAAGNDQWQKTLIISYVKNEFVVSALAYQESDQKNKADIESCDINFVSGRSFRDGKAFVGKVELIPLKDWEPDFLPPACEF